MRMVIVLITTMREAISKSVRTGREVAPLVPWDHLVVDLLPDLLLDRYLGAALPLVPDQLPPREVRVALDPSGPIRVAATQLVVISRMVGLVAPPCQRRVPKLLKIVLVMLMVDSFLQ